jgi:sialic acid synthase SpsE
MNITLKNGHTLGDGCACFIIAEAGINHNGDFDLARRLIDSAAKIGVDAIKFQKRTITEMYTSAFLDQEYGHNQSFGSTYRAHKEHLEFSDEQYVALARHAREGGIAFLASGFDSTSFTFIDTVLDVPVHKIASPLVRHHPLLRKVARLGKPMFMSTGMHSLEEVTEALGIIRSINPNIVLMQTTSLYPCDDSQVHLNVMVEYRRRFEVLVGYSSHDRGIAIPVGARALGACVIEKHFTLDRTMRGPDHAASVEPRGLELILRYVRAVEASLGSTRKAILPEEERMRAKYCVSLVAQRDLHRGERLTEDMLTYKSPGSGIPPSVVSEVVGRVLVRDVRVDTTIMWEDLG